MLAGDARANGERRGGAGGGCAQGMRDTYRLLSQVLRQRLAAALPSLTAPAAPSPPGVASGTAVRCVAAGMHLNPTGCCMDACDWPKSLLWLSEVRKPPRARGRQQHC